MFNSALHSTFIKLLFVTKIFQRLCLFLSSRLRQVLLHSHGMPHSQIKEQICWGASVRDFGTNRISEQRRWQVSCAISKPKARTDISYWSKGSEQPQSLLAKSAYACIRSIEHTQAGPKSHMLSK